MTANTLFDDVLALARRLSPADQAQLVATLAAQIASDLAPPASNTPEPLVDDSAVRLPPDSPAGKLVRDPTSALAQFLAQLPEGFVPPTDEEVARWREERLLERYGS